MVNNRGEIFLKLRQHKVCHYKLGITDTADVLNEKETMMSFFSNPGSFGIMTALRMSVHEHKLIFM